MSDRYSGTITFGGEISSKTLKAIKACMDAGDNGGDYDEIEVLGDGTYVIAASNLFDGEMPEIKAILNSDKVPFNEWTSGYYEITPMVNFYRDGELVAEFNSDDDGLNYVSTVEINNLFTRSYHNPEIFFEELYNLIGNNIPPLKPVVVVNDTLQQGSEEIVVDETPFTIKEYFQESPDKENPEGFELVISKETAEKILQMKRIVSQMSEGTRIVIPLSEEKITYIGDGSNVVHHPTLEISYNSITFKCWSAYEILYGCNIMFEYDAEYPDLEKRLIKIAGVE